MGVKTEDNSDEELVVVDDDYPQSSNYSTFFMNPLKHFICREWYGEVEYWLIRDNENHLVYLVNNGMTFWTVYIWKHGCNEARINAQACRLPETYRIQSNNPASSIAFQRNNRMDWTVNSFTRFGFDPYEIFS